MVAVGDFQMKIIDRDEVTVIHSPETTTVVIVASIVGKCPPRRRPR
jgi:hypothetical protein